MNIKPPNALLGAILITTALTLTGCGGGGGGGGSSSVSYSGSTSAAIIDQNNANTISVASGVAVKKASDSVTASSSAFGVSITNTGSSQVNADSISQEVSNILLNNSAPALPVGASLTGSCGGSLSSSSAPPQTGAWSGTATFSNYCNFSSITGTNVTLNGKVNFSFNDINNPLANASLQFSDFTFTNGSQGTVTLNSVSLACTNSVCTYTVDYLASDSQTYRITDDSIIQDTSGGAYNGSYSGTMTFYHPAYGSVSVQANYVTYGSCGNFPDGGSVFITSVSGGSATVTFNSDCTFTGTYNTSSSSVSIGGNTAW